ncbi:unnamed protein product [Ascophyllum nodosum]
MSKSTINRLRSCFPFREVGEFCNNCYYFAKKGAKIRLLFTSVSVSIIARGQGWLPACVYCMFRRYSGIFVVRVYRSTPSYLIKIFALLPGKNGVYCSTWFLL